MTIDESASQPQKKKWWLWILIGVLVVGGVGNAMRGDKDAKPGETIDQGTPLALVEPATQGDEDVPEPEVAVEPEQKEAEEPTPDEEIEPEPSLTVSQRNAIRKAESYLDVMPFSKTGLIRQLKYEGFSAKEAKFAVDYIDVDWGEQAVSKAENYLGSSAFSKKGLIGQLKYEGFTTSQSKKAVEALDVDWNEQAALKAQRYLDYSSFSKKRLIDQLKYEGFTDKQAKFGVKAVGL